MQISTQSTVILAIIAQLSTIFQYTYKTMSTFDSLFDPNNPRLKKKKGKVQDPGPFSPDKPGYDPQAAAKNTVKKIQEDENAWQERLRKMLAEAEMRRKR